MPIIKKNILLSAPLWILGCVPPPLTGVQGGVLVPIADLHGRPEQVYGSGTCRKKDGSVADDSGGVEYEVRPQKDGPALLEHSVSEVNGRLISNSWSEGRATHFFVWLPEGSGFEYVVPGDASKPAQRRTYARVEVRSVKDRGRRTVQPIGQPEMICELPPIQ